jgi:hypothetical protein
VLFGPPMEPAVPGHMRRDAASYLKTDANPRLSTLARGELFSRRKNEDKGSVKPNMSPEVKGEGEEKSGLNPSVID